MTKLFRLDLNQYHLIFNKTFIYKLDLFRDNDLVDLFDIATEEMQNKNMEKLLYFHVDQYFLVSDKVSIRFSEIFRTLALFDSASATIEYVR